MIEQRSGVLDRRRSNWRDAIRLLPPSDKEAVALRGCIDEIRLILAEDDGHMVDQLRLRTWLDGIEMAVMQLDEVLRG